MTTGKTYKFSRADFQPLTVAPLHLDLLFDVHPTEVSVTSQTTFKNLGKNSIDSILLNAKNLSIVSVEVAKTFIPLVKQENQYDFVGHVASFDEFVSVIYAYDVESSLIKIQIGECVAPGGQFVVRSKSVATPTKNVLEGLYFDHTPDDAPQTIITQCQQYGFQRIVPCIDTMDAKSFYTTTIIADRRYSNIITNGDPAPEYMATDGAPLYKAVDHVREVSVGEDRHVACFYNHKVCMAPYLFFLGVGTYATYRQTLEFPDGDTTLLELLVLPGRATPDHAKKAVKMLHDSILWVMIGLGPEATEHVEERNKIYELLEEREVIKERGQPQIANVTETIKLFELCPEDENRLRAIRCELKELLKCWKKTGYKYTGAVYREIGMENSYYGGMENVGNTTIVSSCLCPSPSMDDVAYEYMERVKVHEYYHNLNGSEVTGQSPFEIWLNEAVTVHMERKRHAVLFGEDYSRLSAVAGMFRPALGPLAQDRTATSMAVEPEGFNQTQELVSAVTYSKAPEFVRMVESLMGKASFDRGLDKYHTKFKLGNATTGDWIKSMEDECKRSFSGLASTWLKRCGYPDVSYETKYDPEAKSYCVSLTQSGYENLGNGTEPWHIPIDWALVKDSVVIYSGIFEFTCQHDTLIIDGVNVEPDYLSFARGWSYFGKSENLSATFDSLKLQALTDPDAVNRYFAYRSIADGEKTRVVRSLVNEPESEVIITPDFVNIHCQILFDSAFASSTRAITLAEPEAVNSNDVAHRYQEINKARKLMLAAVWQSSSEKVLSLYKDLQDLPSTADFIEQVHCRQLKKHLMSVMCCGLQATECQLKELNLETLTKDLIFKSTSMTDQCLGLRSYLELPKVQGRAELQTKVFEDWAKDSNKLERYIGIVSSLDTTDFAIQVRSLMENAVFNVNLSHHSRTVCRGLSQIRHRTVLTDEGLELMSEVFTKIGRVNQMSAYPILKCFDSVSKFSPELKQKVFAALHRMQDSINKKSEESLYNQLNNILAVEK